jgi:OOP family OmpA-OmpF porin
MKAVRALVLVSMVALVGSCASTPDPVLCGQIGLGLGLGGGVAGGAAIGEDSEAGEIVGFGLLGAVVGGAGGYFLCRALQPEEEEEAPAPPPPAPKPAPAPAPREPEADPCAQVIRLRGVNFDFDKATIRSDAAVILDEAAVLLGEAIEACPSRRVAVEGHTDATGPDAYNQGLSERRAASVRDYLVRKGADAGKLETAGYGESRPIAGNETREGRALNRRVELRLVQ